MERKLLERYLNNTCTEQEREEVMHWLSDQDNEKEVKQYIENAWNEFEIKEDSGDFNMSFKNISKRINAEKISGKNGLRWLWPDKKQQKWVYAAAACLAIILTGIWIDFRLQKQPYKIKNFITVQTQKGERTQVLLNDGSEVYLNAETKLVYFTTASSQPVVYMEGEAFFKVSDKGKPLIVKTAGGETTVEASQFNISAFPKDSTITIAVEEGKAKVRSNDETSPLLTLRIPENKDTSGKKVLPLTKLYRPLIKLRPAVVANEQQYITINKREGSIDVHTQMNAKALFGWKDGIIYFENADSTEIVNTLERWYGVNIGIMTNGHPLPAYTAEFHNNNLKDVVQKLSATLGLEYQIEGNNVYLSKQLN